MLADAIRSRSRAFKAPLSLRLNLKKSRRSAGMWVLVGVPVLLMALFVWQVVSPYLHTDLVVRGAVAVARSSLEADTAGSRIEFVLVDRIGQDTTVSGALNIKLREPDGGVWQVNKTVTPADFAALPAGGLLAGRLGYSVVVPAADWLRAPRHGGSATVTIGVQPTEGAAFSSVDEERFP